MTNEEAIEIINRENDPNDKKVWELFPEYREALDMAIKALEQQPCIQEKQANADKIDAVYIDGFKAGYSQARFDLEQEPCDDAISRKSILKYIDDWWSDSRDDIEDLIIYITYLPPVTPQQKYGKWNEYYTSQKGNDVFNCKECGHTFVVTQGKDNMNYCPNCGFRMVEPQESEEV